MKHVFISYSRKDTDLVDQMVAELEKAGFDVWIDRHDIHTGSEWRVQIVEAIDTCDAFILMVSDNSANSKNVLKEVDLADGSERVIFPIYLEDVKLPPTMRYHLAGLQHIELYSIGIEKGTESLISDLKKLEKKIKSTPAETNEAELVIKGVDIDKFDDEEKQELLSFVSDMTSSNKSELKIANVETGSLHVFVQMPQKSAFELKTNALNRSKRFKEFKIVALRLKGDKKFVNTSLGILTSAAIISWMRWLWLSLPPVLPTVVGAAIGKGITIAIGATIVGTAALGVANSISSPIIEATRTSTSTATIPTFTPTITTTDTIEPSDTPSATLTPDITPTEGDANLTFTVDVVCRVGPTNDYHAVGSFFAGTTVPIAGQNGDHWVVLHERYNNQPCWVHKRTGTATAAAEFVPIIDIPFLTPTATPTPTATYTPDPRTDTSIHYVATFGTFKVGDYSSYSIQVCDPTCPSIGAATGTVTITVDNKSCSGSVDIYGNVTCSILMNNAGTFAIYVSYAGDSNFKPSSASSGSITITP